MSEFNPLLFEKMPVVGILRSLTLAEIEIIIPEYINAGLTTLEVTLNAPDALNVIGRLRGRFSQLNIGAGTVCTMKDLKLALKAGASFIVMPIFDEQIVKFCVERDIPVFPGAFSPLEIFKAATAGATAVKVFPATQLGPQYIRDVLAPLDQMKLLPTGGVNLDNIEAFFNAGAVGVGMGSTLFPPELIKTNSRVQLHQHFCAVVEKVKGVYKKRII